MTSITKEPKPKIEPRPVDFVQARLLMRDSEEFTGVDMERISHLIDYLEVVYAAGVHPTVALKEYAAIMLGRQTTLEAFGE